MGASKKDQYPIPSNQRTISNLKIPKFDNGQYQYQSIRVKKVILPILKDNYLLPIHKSGKYVIENNGLF